MILPTLLLLACASSPALPAPQEGSAADTVLVWEYQDPRTDATGAAWLLRRARAEVRELDLDRPLAGQAADMLVLGTRVSDHPRYAEWMRAHRTELRDWVRRGHVLVQFPQPWRKEERPPFLPRGTTAARGDGDLPAVYVLQPRHLLFLGLPLAGEENPPVLDLPRHLGKGPGYGFFDQQAGGTVLAAGDPAGEAPVILEFPAGRGRVLLVGIAFDKVRDARGRPLGSPAFREAAGFFFMNLVEYAWHVRHRSPESKDLAHFVSDEDAAALRDAAAPATDPGADDGSGAETDAPVPVEVLVFEDADGNGRRDPGEAPLAGVPVGHEAARARTDADGRARLTVPRLNALPAWVRVPAAFSLTSPFRILLDAGVAPPEGLHVEVGLRPPPEKEAARRDRSPLRCAVLPGPAPAPEALAALQDLLRALDPADRPLFLVAGGQLLALPDVAGPPGAPARPPHLSWEVPGWHCLLLARQPALPVDLAWLQDELGEVAQGRRTMLFLQGPPGPDLSRLLAAAPPALLVQGGGSRLQARRVDDRLEMVLPAARPDAGPVPCAVLLDIWSSTPVRETVLPLVAGPPLFLAPSDEDAVRDGSLPVLALLPPALEPVSARVLGSVQGGGESNTRLETCGLLSWVGALPLPAGAGEASGLRLRLEAGAPPGDVRRAVRRLALRARPPAPAEPGDFRQRLGDGRRSGYVPGTAGFRSGFALDLATPSDLIAPLALRRRGDRLLLAGYAPASPTASRLVCLDAVTGQRRWQQDLPAPPLDLALPGELAVVLLEDGRLAAFATDFGDAEWTAEPALPAGARPAPLLLDGDRLVVPWGGGAVALDPATGAVLWTSRPESAGPAGPCTGASLAAGRLAVAGPEELLLLDARDGAFLARWDGPAASPILSRDARRLRVIRNGRVEGWRAGDRERRTWEQEMATELLPGGAAGPLVAGGRRLFLACGDGRLRAWDDRSGEALWPDPPLWNAAAGPPFLLLTSAEVLVLERSGFLRLLEARRGRELAGRKLGLPVTAAPVLARNRLHVAAWDGAVLALAPVR